MPKKQNNTTIRHIPKTSKKKKASPSYSSGNKKENSVSILGRPAMDYMSVASKYSVLGAGRRNYANIRSSKMEKGVQKLVVDFGQFVSDLTGRNNSNHILSDSTGMPVQGIPIAPYYIGGLLWDIAKNYDQFRFQKLEVAFIPTAGTDQSGTFTAAYLPNGADLVAIERLELNGDSSIFGVLGSAFKVALGAVASAAGSVFAPLKVAVGTEILKGAVGVGSALATAATKYFQNKKIATADLSVLGQQMLDQIQRAEDAALFDSNVKNWMTDLLTQNPTLVSSITPFTAPTSGTITGADALTMLHTLLQQAEGELCCSLGLNAHGVLLAASQHPIATSAPSGVTPLGSIYLTGTVELVGLAGTSLATSGSAAFTYGDPLDVADPDPDHKLYDAVDRTAYLSVAIRGFATFSATVLDKQYPRKSLPVHHDWLRISETIADKFVRPKQRTMSGGRQSESLRSNTSSDLKSQKVPQSLRVERIEVLSELESAKLVSSLQRAIALPDSSGRTSGARIRDVLDQFGLMVNGELDTVMVSRVDYDGCK